MMPILNIWNMELFTKVVTHLTTPLTISSKTRTKRFDRTLNKPYELPFISLRWISAWFSYQSNWHTKANICDQLMSSVYDFKCSNCSNTLVSEFINEVHGIIDITIIHFTVPWVFSFERTWATLPLSRHLTRKILEVIVSIYWK